MLQRRNHRCLLFIPNLPLSSVLWQFLLPLLLLLWLPETRVASLHNHRMPTRLSSFRRFTTTRMASTTAATSTQPSAYEQCVRRLYETNMFHPVKMGLDNSLALYNTTQPLQNRVVVHIAGTNGKGSVAYKIAATLQKQHRTVGLFTSPHIASFRERMQINGTPIREEQVVELLPRVYQYCEDLRLPATFFEITTALAMLFFAESNADVVVLETGLGGRLDATNVVPNPALAVITSIGLEHTRILGDTIELIAKEKAGIMKKDCPVLVGPQVPLDVMRQCAQEKGVSRLCTCEDVLGPNEQIMEGEEVDFDLENARIAKAALRLLNDRLGPFTEDDIEQGISQRPPCRFQIMSYQGRRVVLDVAHNPPAMDYLVRKLATSFAKNTPIRFVVGLSADKDASLCAESLLRAVNGDVTRLHLVQAAHPRAAQLEKLLEVFPTGVRANLEDRSVRFQLEAALQDMADNEVLVICGSVFLMAEAREQLGVDEPRDSAFIAEVAGAGVRYAQENFGSPPAR